MSKFRKSILAVAGLTTAVAMLGVVAVPQVGAQTVEQQIAILLAQIQALQAQVASLSGSGTAVSGTACSFTRNLTIGSRGADVTCLQNYLTSTGHFNFAGGATGFFGPITQSAVAAWQAANGITPSTGYFGPISRANYSSMMAAVPPTTTTPPVATTPGTTPVVTDGTDGSITVSSSSVVSSGQQVKKGETKNVYSTKLQATAGPVNVTRVDVKFSERPWLTMNQVQIKDGNGNILATKALTGPSDATEVTIGSDYRVRVEGLNLVVNPGTDVHLVIAVSVLASSDKITGQTVTISIPAGGIRTINGKGFTETIDGSGSFTFTLPTSGSNADIYTSISPNSPLAGFRTIAAGTTQTPNVTLGVFRIKSQNTATTLNSLSFNINRSTSVATSTLFSNVQLMIDGKTYGAAGLAAGDTTFTNMQANLPVDQWVEVTLKATVAGADVSSGVSASTTLVAASISGIDTNFNTPTISNATDVTSADQTFLQSSAVISNASGVLGNANADPATSYSATYKFTLTNTGNSGDIFISKTPGIALATSSSPSVASSTITVVNVDNPSEYTGDTSTSYALPAGTSRSFTYTGVISKDGLNGGLQTLSITGVKFGATNAANAAFTISTGLGNLMVTANLPSN